MNVVILRRVTVGNGSVIGAGAGVTHDVEPYSIVVGIPAKPVRRRFSDEIISGLEEVRWWDWPDELIQAHCDALSSGHLDTPQPNHLRAVQRQLG